MDINRFIMENLVQFEKTAKTDLKYRNNKPNEKVIFGTEVSDKNVQFKSLSPPNSGNFVQERTQPVSQQSLKFRPQPPTSPRPSKLYHRPFLTKYVKDEVPSKETTGSTRHKNYIDITILQTYAYLDAVNRKKIVRRCNLQFIIRLFCSLIIVLIAFLKHRYAPVERNQCSTRFCELECYVMQETPEMVAVLLYESFKWKNSEKFRIGFRFQHNVLFF